MIESVRQAINSWVNGNTDDVIEYLWLSKPNIVALFCREFVFGDDAPYDMSKRETQLNIICNRLADYRERLGDLYQESRTDLTPAERRRLGL